MFLFFFLSLFFCFSLLSALNRLLTFYFAFQSCYWRVPPTRCGVPSYSFFPSSFLLYLQIIRMCDRSHRLVFSCLCLWLLSYLSHLPLRSFLFLLLFSLSPSLFLTSPLLFLSSPLLLDFPFLFSCSSIFHYHTTSSLSTSSSILSFPLPFLFLSHLISQLIS